jgi:hypothetical protein
VNDTCNALLALALDLHEHSIAIHPQQLASPAGLAAAAARRQRLPERSHRPERLWECACAKTIPTFPRVIMPRVDPDDPIRKR